MQPDLASVQLMQNLLDASLDRRMVHAVPGDEFFDNGPQRPRRQLRVWNVHGVSLLHHTKLIAMDVPFDVQRWPIQLSEIDLEEADLVIDVKEAEQRAMMEEQSPEWANRIKYTSTSAAHPTTSDFKIATVFDRTRVPFHATLFKRYLQSGLRDGRRRRGAFHG